MEGNVTKTGPVDHLTFGAIESILSEFRGEISQIPPIFSALRKDGKKLYQSAREGVSADDMDIEARKVRIMKLDLIPSEVQLPKFEISMECGGGALQRTSHWNQT